ncbi:tryptophan--tRNA ligase [Hyphobacterium sp. CCMP332]|nr:tryptophan--tRNA ligase [Hyphobacterium sp. CCMP332]
MARILTGIQSTGRPHLGNILGAIKPGIKMAEEVNNDAYFFIADLHSLTTIKDAGLREEYVHAVAASWLAFGFDTDKNVFYRQSDIHEVAELTWILSCFTPYPMLANAHSFKDKSNNLHDVNAGLFTYPVLMTADIILYDADFVPVGKDQKQHLEMCRDIASAFNRVYDSEVFVIPEAMISKDTMLVPGTDGRKMSKSYNNYIDIFLAEKALKKQIMSIVTDSTPLEEPKDAENCLVYQLFKLIASETDANTMKSKLEAGNYGYGHAKKDLLGFIIDNYKSEREKFDEFMKDKAMLEMKLQQGAEKARLVAREVIKRVKDKTGYKTN